MHLMDWVDCKSMVSITHRRKVKSVQPTMEAAPPHAQRHDEWTDRLARDHSTECWRPRFCTHCRCLYESYRQCDYYSGADCWQPGFGCATTVFATSDGNTLVEPTDTWFGTDDGDGTGTPAIVHLLRNAAGIQPSNIEVIGDNVVWDYSLTVPAVKRYGLPISRSSRPRVPMPRLQQACYSVRRTHLAVKLPRSSPQRNLLRLQTLNSTRHLLRYRFRMLQSLKTRWRAPSSERLPPPTPMLVTRIPIRWFLAPVTR